MSTAPIAQGPVDVNVSRMTIDRLKDVVALMRKNAIRPCVVKTKKEAREMTLNDRHLTGHKWRVGEEYYHAETLHATIPLPANVQLEGPAPEGSEPDSEAGRRSPRSAG